MVFGHVEHKTNIRFKKKDDFESYINAIDNDYDSKDVSFTGCVYKLNTPQFKVLKRSADAEGPIYMKKIVESHGQKCYIPNSGMCFIKCNNFFTNKDYTEEFRDLFRNEENQSGVITSARTRRCFNKMISTLVVLTERE